MAEPTARPFGRNLGDFLNSKGKLPAPEQALREACARGVPFQLGLTRPEKGTTRNRVRASFIRFLALGGDVETPVHENGVWLKGCWIDGVLDLSFCTLLSPLQLHYCRLQELKATETRLVALNLRATIVIDGISANGVQISGSLVLNEGFSAKGSVMLLKASIGGDLYCNNGLFENDRGVAIALDRASIMGGVFMQYGFKATGTVRLAGAMIGGSLECDGGSFENNSEVALYCDSVKINRSVFLREGFCAIGEVLFVGAHIGGDLVCKAGRFLHKEGDALSCHGASITKNVFLDSGFIAEGKVSLLGADIGGSLFCGGGKFDSTNGDGQIGTALACGRATIRGSVFLDNGFTARGDVRLPGASVGSLIDPETDWPQPGTLILDGIRIGRFSGSAPTDGTARVRWLQLQPPVDLFQEFKPQPWEETIRLLREMGHYEDARIVAIAKQQQLRSAGKFRGVAHPLHILYGWLVGYGHRPMRLLGRVGGAWLFLTLAFWAAANPGVFGSTTHLIAPTQAGTDAACPAGPGKAACEALPTDYRSFFAPAYAADLLVPVINLGYKTQWQPLVSLDGKPLFWGHALRFLAWAGILFGWVASLLLVGVLTNLIKKD